MDRRTFLNCCAAGMAVAAGTPALGRPPAAGLFIADPHAHPHPLRVSRNYDHTTPTLGMMRELDMTLCAFAAVGDLAYIRNRAGGAFGDTQSQLDPIRELAGKGLIRPVLKATDLGALAISRAVPGALLAVEGADALEGRLENLDALHTDGVRMITLLHERDNELGCNQRSNAGGALTPFGIKVVERMNRLGMVIDVAHANSATLKGIAEASALPLVDSHTSPVLPGEEDRGSRRLRSWQEMERVAKTGGVICTWPLAYADKHAERTTLAHWAAEIVQMKARLGIEHCGLGTDSGGGLPRLVAGWESLASLPALIDAMRTAGLTQEDIAAFVGGNFLRVLGKCLA